MRSQWDSQILHGSEAAVREIIMVGVLGFGFGVLSGHGFNHPMPWTVERFQETEERRSVL